MNTADSPGDTEFQRYITGYTNENAQNWLTQALHILVNAGLQSQQGAAFIMTNNTQIRIRDFSWWQQGMGIRWTLDGAIEMRADNVSWQNDVRRHLLPGLVHEAKHLEQGKRIALSQLGEVQAWFTEYQVRQELRLGKGHIPMEVVDWGANPTKTQFDLARQAIIQQQTRHYLFWLLPRYPYPANYDVNLGKLP